MQREERALVKNASSRAQLVAAERMEKERAEQWDRDLRAMLQTPEGRRVLWGILGHCSILESIYHPSSQIYHNAGRQDVGHWLLKQLESADSRALLSLMEEEHRLTSTLRKTHAG